MPRQPALYRQMRRRGKAVAHELAKILWFRPTKEPLYYFRILVSGRPTALDFPGSTTRLPAAVPLASGAAFRACTNQVQGATDRAQEIAEGGN
jgi:hypothetical protein